jgi:hypothetical protein
MLRRPITVHDIRFGVTAVVVVTLMLVVVFGVSPS